MQRPTLALVAIALGLTACADAPIDVLISGHAPLEGTLNDEGELEDCTAPSELGSGTLIQQIHINLADAEGAFALGVVMENQLTDSSSYAPIGEGPNQRLNQNHIEVQGYELTFTGDDGFDNLGTMRYEATGIIPTDGVLYARVPLVTAADVADWQDSLSIAADGVGGAIAPTFAEFQVIGRTVGGSNIESNVLTIPITVCDGCAEPSTPICIDPAVF